MMACIATLSIAVLQNDLQVLILLDKAPMDDIDNDVGLTNIDQHVVLQKDGRFLSHKDAIADS